jgi:hypothetical protein
MCDYETFAGGWESLCIQLGGTERFSSSCSFCLIVSNMMFSFAYGVEHTNISISEQPLIDGEKDDVSQLIAVLVIH